MYSIGRCAKRTCGLFPIIGNVSSPPGQWKAPVVPRRRSCPAMTANHSIRGPHFHTEDRSTCVGTSSVWATLLHISKQSRQPAGGKAPIPHCHPTLHVDLLSDLRTVHHAEAPVVFWQWSCRTISNPARGRFSTLGLPSNYSGADAAIPSVRQRCNSSGASIRCNSSGATYAAITAVQPNAATSLLQLTLQLQ